MIQQENTITLNTTETKEVQQCDLFGAPEVKKVRSVKKVTLNVSSSTAGHSTSAHAGPTGTFCAVVMNTLGLIPEFSLEGDPLKHSSEDFSVHTRFKGNVKAGKQGSIGREVLVFRAVDTARQRMCEEFAEREEDAESREAFSLLVRRLALMEADEDPNVITAVFLHAIRPFARNAKADRLEVRRQQMRLLRAMRKVEKAKEEGKELILEDVLAATSYRIQDTYAESYSAKRNSKLESIEVELDDSNEAENDVYMDIADADFEEQATQLADSWAATGSVETEPQWIEESVGSFNDDADWDDMAAY